MRQNSSQKIQIIFATGNKGKIREIREILGLEEGEILLPYSCQNNTGRGELLSWIEKIV